MVLIDPYHNCKLVVRTPEHDDDVEVEFEHDGILRDLPYEKLAVCDTKSPAKTSARSDSRPTFCEKGGEQKHYEICRILE